VPLNERSGGATPPEQPILWLGMAGFRQEERAVMARAFERPSGHPQWRACPFGEADAWWVSGERTQVGSDGHLRVAAGLPNERALKLDLAEVDRPVAFSLPLASADFEPACTFKPEAEASMLAVLLQFESWLWFVRAEFVLGALLVRRPREQRRGIWQVSRGGRLLAILDFEQGHVGVLPRVHPVDLWEAQWDHRPPSARDIPPAFARTTPAQLAWAYVRRSDWDLLPARYRTDTIYYRQAPAVPMRWLRDSQLLLMRELSAEPATLSTLRQLTGMPVSQIERDLTCLYYAGAITTTRASAGSHPRADSVPYAPELASLLRGAPLTQPPASALARPPDPPVSAPASAPSHDLTVPASLEHRVGMRRGDGPPRSR
jgi:hypothetical protein